MRAFPNLPIAYLPEKSSKDFLVVIWIDHRIDKTKFMIGHYLGVITVTIDATAILILRTREDEIILALPAVDGMKDLRQR